MAKLFDLSNLDWNSWIYGLVSAFIGGGSSAVVSGFVVAVNDPSHYNFQQGRFYFLVLSVFAASGTLNFFAYLKQNPVPVVVQTVTEGKKTETNAQGGTAVTEIKQTTTKTVATDSPADK